MKKLLNEKVLILLILIGVVSCSSEDDLKEQTQVQTKEEIDAQNKNIDKWSKELVADYKVRQQFLNNITGKYVGEFINSIGLKMKIRLNIVSSSPVYLPDRKTPIEEVQSYIKNLGVNVDVVQWNEEEGVSSGCSYESIAPDFEKGLLNLISRDCDYSFAFTFLGAAKSTKNVSVVNRIKTQFVAATRETTFFPYVDEIRLKRLTKNKKVDDTKFYQNEYEFSKISDLKNEIERKYKIITDSMGEYSSELDLLNSKYIIRLTMVDANPYKLERRYYSYDELVEILEGLSMDISLSLWKKGSPVSVINCFFEDRIYNYEKSNLELSSADCENSLSISFDERNLLNLNSELLIKRMNKKIDLVLSKGDSNE